MKDPAEGDLCGVGASQAALEGCGSIGVGHKGVGVGGGVCLKAPGLLRELLLREPLLQKPASGGALVDSVRAGKG